MKPIEKILHAKREEIRRQKISENLETIRGQAEEALPVRDFRGAIHTEGRISLIAEIKRSSPSRGRITDIDVADLARRYDESRAAAISVLTDPHFDGTIEHLSVVRDASDKPVLRKDFILDVYQVYQARAYGADAVLLIASILEEDALAELFNACRETGLHTLIESHSEQDLSKIPKEAEIYGINNRDLNSAGLDIDMETAPKLLPMIPEGKTVVCESGIFTHEDIQKLAGLGRINAVLVGTAIIASGRPTEKIAELLGGTC